MNIRNNNNNNNNNKLNLKAPLSALKDLRSYKVTPVLLLVYNALYLCNAHKHAFYFWLERGL